MDDPNTPAPAITTVHRYEMPTIAYESMGTVYEVEMPQGAQILSFAPAGVYALVDTSAKMVTRRFFAISTGKPIARPEMLRYIGTPAQGRHFFEVVEQTN